MQQNVNHSDSNDFAVEKIVLMEWSISLAKVWIFILQQKVSDSTFGTMRLYLCVFKQYAAVKILELMKKL